MLNFALVAGSSRNNSQSGKVARFLRQRLIQLGCTDDHHSSVIDLGLAPLPLWPAEDMGAWALYSKQLAAADALVIISPEWNGMACPAIKNFFIYASKAELAHKPGLLVGVSSGIGGAYPISELRASSSLSDFPMVFCDDSGLPSARPSMSRFRPVDRHTSHLLPPS
ncbi:NADPH-dependent FMN reductase, partial [Pseudomonas sp.]|uniref:NADPH-dependent FMN reductase n=1 Tax=Pseudomonas sp. TaxID=306 RepID=UPI0037C7A3AD